MKLLPLLFLALATRLCASKAEHVVVVANASLPDSIAVARHYMAARAIPEANLVALPMPTGETVTWRQFVSEVWGPLAAELVLRGWIDAIPMDLVDEVGRRKYAVSGHRIEAMALCWGVPLRIANDPTLLRDVPPLTQHEEFRTNQASVDSELSLIAQTGTPITACVPNPLFHNYQPSEEDRRNVVKVARLDGPTPADAMALVDHAVEAERTGLLGRAYVDKAGPHESGNRWLSAAAARLDELGFDTSVGLGPATMGQGSRFDAPVLYFGWYTSDISGPFLLPGFRFPPGAVAVHIHSFSAHTLRSASEGWCGPLVARGATATVGNVFEPYLEYLHRPDLLLDALSQGRDLVDAAYYALPVLSWQCVVVGDPLYTPFAVTSAAQARMLRSLPEALGGYAVVRRMNILAAQGRPDDALAAGRLGMRERPNLALALALGRRMADAGNREAAAWMVRDAAQAEAVSVSAGSLFAEAGDFLSRIGRPGEAVTVYRKLLEQDGIPPEAAVSWFASGRRIALESGDTALAAQWREQMSAAMAAHPTR
jgi:uncharacterized protein (TIGR03790 family)